MHDGQFFVLTIIAFAMVAGIAKTWIRARHGIAPDRGRRLRGRYGGEGSPDAERRVALLTNENERLTGQVSRLEERIAVLERIATDPAERTAREIDALRDR